MKKELASQSAQDLTEPRGEKDGRPSPIDVHVARESVCAAGYWPCHRSGSAMRWG